MKELIKMVVSITHIISFVIILVVGAMGVMYELIGHVKFEKLFDSIGISNGFQTLWIVGAIAFVLLLLTYFIKTKFNNN